MIVYFLGDYHHVVIIRVNTIEQIYNIFENVRRLNLSLFKGLPQQTRLLKGLYTQKVYLPNEHHI